MAVSSTGKLVGIFEIQAGNFYIQLATEGGLLLLSFGLGTVPGLFLVGTGASGFVRRYRQYSDLLSGMLMIGIAVSLSADALQVMLAY